MNESIYMQATMDAGLRASFQQAAARERRPATQVLQALMRDPGARHSRASLTQSRFELIDRASS